MSNTVEAYVGGAAVTTDVGGVDIDAISNYDVDALALAMSASGLVAGVGTLTLNMLSNMTSASLRPDADIDAAGAVTLNAVDTSTAHADSGGLAGGGLVGFGGSVALNFIDNQVEAYSDSADVTAGTGQFLLDASSSNDVGAFALAFGAGGIVGGYATVMINEATTATDASIRNDGTIEAPIVTLRARDDSTFNADGGGLAASLGVGAGGTLGKNALTTSVSAGIGGADVTTTSGNVDVAATSSFDVDASGMGFSIAGLVGGVGTAMINELTNSTRAFIDDGARVDSAAEVRVIALDDSSAAADAGGMAGGALVGAGLSFASSKVISDVQAVIDGETTQVQAAGALTLHATLSPDVSASAVGLGFSGFAAATGAVAISETGGQAKAGVLNKATVDAASVSIRGSSDAAPEADASGLAGAVFAAGGVMISETLAGHSAVAEANGTITAGQLEVVALGNRSGAADSNYAGIAVFTGEVGFEAEHTAGNTEAIIGDDANITIANGGDVTVTATSVDTVDPHIVDVGAGLFTIGAQATSAVIASNTRAKASGRVNARNVSVASTATKTADATTDIVNISILSLNGVILDNIAGALPDDLPIIVMPPFDTDARANIGGENDASLGGKANITASGALSITATSTNNAEASNLSAGATIVNVSDTAANATVGGSTRMHIDEGAAINVGTLTTTAFANNDANARGDYAGAAGVNITTADIVARTSHLVAAYLGPEAGQNPVGTSNTTLTVASGGMNLNASSTNDATVGQVTLDASLVTVEKVKPEANAGGTTRAHVGGKFNINASGVNATATSTNNADSSALAFEIGLVDVDNSEKSANTTHVTEAFVGPQANLAISGGALTLDATSQNDASIDMISPIDLGVVDLNFISSTADAGGVTRSYVAQGSTLSAAALTANASADNDASIDRFQFGASIVSLNEATPRARTTHHVESYVGPAVGVAPSGPAGTITLGGALTLNADSVNEATIDEVSIGVGVVNIDLAKPDMNAGGTTRTYIGGDYTINATGVSGQADSVNTAGSDTVPIKIGLVSVGEVSAEVRTTHEAEAFVTRGADFTLNGGGIALGATSRNVVDFDSFELGASLVSVGTFKPWLETAGATRAFVEQGATLAAGSLSLNAAAANTAQLDAAVVAVSLVDISVIRPTVRTTHVVDAYVGPRAGVAPDGASSGSISLGGALSIAAGQLDAGNRATVDSFSLSVGLVNFDSMRPDVMAGGQTLAHLGGNFNIAAGAVEVTANAPNNLASSDVFALNVGLVNIGVGGATTPVRVTHETAAYVADGANLAVTGGALGFTADSKAAASTENFNIEVGLVQVSDISSEARVEGSTRAYVGGGARLTAGNVTFKARSVGNTAAASMSNVDVGLVDVVDLNPTAVTTNIVETFIAGGAIVNAGNVALDAELEARADADVDTGGFAIVSVASVDPTANAENLVKAFVDGQVTSADLDLNATATRTADATAAVIAIGVVGAAGADSHSNTTGNTQVYFGSGSRVTASGNVAGNAVSINRSTAKSTASAGGVVGIVGTLESTAVLTGGTTAYFNQGAQVLGAGNVELSAVGANTAKADTTAGTGGVVSVRGSQATATVTPVVEAVIDNDVSMQNVGGSVTLHAESLRAEGDSTARSYGGGVVDVGAANADTNVTPTVNAYIDTGANLNVGGSVTVEALIRAEPAVVLGDTFNPDQNTIDNDTITFSQHGLATGDRVTYQPNGNPAIATADGGTLQSGREYRVIVTGDDTLQLGAVFNAEGANTGDALAPEDGVDATRDRIRFAVAHGFESGDAVKYTADGTSVSTDLNAGGTYFVRKLDDFTIKLYGNRDEALGAGGFADDGFFPGSVDATADTITVFGSGYSENQAVTYRAAPSVAFTSEATDFDAASASATDNNRIYVPGHGFGNGNRVIYRVQPGGAPIGGLVSGTAYYVIVIDGNYIQLAATPEATDPDDGDDDVEITPIALSPDKNPPHDQERHLLVREAIGGLADGVTYYARNVSGDTFQLATSPGGAPITNLNGAGRVGLHAFTRPGFDLSAQSGIHSLRLDLTSAPGANHLLLGEDGVSLRELNPPAGDGQSSATAKGGGGGFVAVGNPDADLVITQNVQAYLAPANLVAGGNVTVRSSSVVNSTSNASNDGGGFVAVGNSDSNNDVNHNNRAYIGVDAGGGNIVADGVNIVAAGHLSLSTDSRLDVKSVSDSDAGGFVADVDAESKGTLNDETQVVAGTNARVTARSVSMRSQWSHLNFVYDSESDAGGFAGDADATASGSVNPHATVAIRSGAQVTGYEGVDIRARLNDMTFTQIVDPDFDGLFGDGDPHPDATYNPQTLIDADPGGLIVAGPRLFPGPGVPAIDVTPLQQPPGFDRLALFVEIDAEDGTRDIAWDSNVILLPGPNPTLIVGPDGRIVKAINAGVVGVGSNIGSYVDPDNDGSFRVVDIINDNDRGQALFRADDEANPDLATALPNGPLFTFRETYVGVEILNQSALDMVIGEIEVVNTFLSTPEREVILEVNHVDDFEFDVNHDFKPTLIEISNTYDVLDGAVPDITFADVVNNPIGMTQVFNARGDIVSTQPGGGEFPPPAGLIRTDSFRIDAVLGDVGRSDSERLRMEIVESNDGPTGSDRYRTSDAGGRNYMELRGLLRRALVGNEGTTGFDVDVERIKSGSFRSTDVNLELLNGLLQPTVVPGPYEIEVFEDAIVSTPANAPGPTPRTTIVTDHFRTSPGTVPTIFPRGVWGAGFGAVDVRYVFGQALDANRRIISGANIDIVGLPFDKTPYINILGWTDLIGDGFLGIENIDVLTSGHITLTEELGDMRVGRIESRFRDVNLTGRNADIIDVRDDPEADVVGVNLTFNAPKGRVGTFENPLEIDSSRPTNGVVKGDAASDIVLIETEGDLNVDRIRSEADDVSLTTLGGSMFDAFDDAEADSIGVNLIFQANKGRIGDSNNDFDIDSSTARPGRLIATASSHLYLQETDSSMNVQQAVTPGGIVRLTVRDSEDTDEDFILMEGGIVFSNEASITIQAGDDVDTRMESAMFTPGEIFIRGDFGDADPGLGSRIVLRGAMIGDRTTINTLRDDDEVRIENGILNTFIFTSGGNDLIFGSDAGTDDPNINDTTYFGDFIDAGPGDDRIFGLGGADFIFAGDGDDFVEGGAHGDSIDGGAGDDDLFGGFGNDLIHGRAGFDDIDGGRGSDILYGEEGDDRIQTGGGEINFVFGGAGDDVLEGSDESQDFMTGEDGRDYLFGRGANDFLVGGAQDDILDGGAGDDILHGGAGKDVLVGGADHDQLFGDDTAAGDDNAVDYLYGDFGTNLNEAGSGRDRLDGQGGNDLLFGEGGDDQIIDALGASNLIDAGAGDDPNTIVLPPATPNPPVEVSPDDPRAVDTLPLGPTYAGWWAEIAASATGSGLSGGVGAALDTTVAVDANGIRYVAWADTRNGNYEIYVARESASGWEMLGGSAAGGGVSDSQTDSRRPALLVFNGRPTVVWTEVGPNGTDIQGAQYDAATDTWVTMGNSLLPGGISLTARAERAQIVEADGRMLVTWIDSSGGIASVYAKVFNGAAWVEITPGSASGSGITLPRMAVSEYDVAAEGSRIAVTWSSGFGDDVEIYAHVREGAGWVGIGGSNGVGGLSQSPTESREPDVAWLNGQLFIAYRERVNDYEQIYVKTFVGGAWVSAGPDGAVKQGVSNTERRSLDPKLEAGGGELFLVWVDHDDADYADPNARIYAKRWNGTQFVETLPGDASGGGISATGGKLSALDLTVDAKGRPTVGWTDDTSGLPQAYLRTVTELPTRVFNVAVGTSIQALLDANDLGAGDVIVLAAGSHAGFTLGGNDAGVTILGAQGGGSTITGAVNVQTGGVLQRLNLSAGVTIANGTSGVALVDNRIGGGGAVVNGGTGLHVLHNRFNGTTGITLAGAAEGLIAHNDIFASATGLSIQAAFTGDIRDNDIRNATVGVRYDAAAPLNGNRIHGNATGIRSTVAGTTDALGFLAGSVPNEISGNAVGVALIDAQMQNQHLAGNERGVIGSGILGGTDIALANVIEGGKIGVDRFDGSIQYNRIAGNEIGIQAESGSRIENNYVYRNAQAGVWIEGESGVEIIGNTMYTPLGDLVRLTGKASDVSVQRNTLWTEDGYDLYVANDSQTGFDSDFNNLYATGKGKVGYWTRDFVDVLDWQADIARFDLHSVGATKVNPEWARPRFESRYNDEYALFPMFGTQRFTSPLQSPEAGVPHIALRTPDLYVDAVRNRALPIRWESFDNGTGSQVKIDLYQETPDGPAFLTTIVAATADDGEFLWTPSASGIAFGTYDLRIQVSWVDNPLVLDRSQETFTVPEDGKDYFVDDGSNANDEYTPAATGDNRNTGKLATAPKPYATNLIRVYDLTAGDRVMIDTGSYSMIDPVAVSGSTNLGLGLDQGFVLTGPTNALRVAELLPAIPGDRSRPLVELNDADGVAIRHLTLRDAQRGVYAHGGSDGLSATAITAFGHALDGIRFETNSPAGDFVQLTSHDNGAWGVFIDGAIRNLQRSVAEDNAAGGIFVRGPADSISQNAARGNAGYGFDIRNPGEALIQRNTSQGNARGMAIDNATGGTAALVGSTTLAPNTANIVYENRLSGIEARGNVMVAGNTVADQIDTNAVGIDASGGANVQSNVVRGNGVGIDATGGFVLGNRVYNNRIAGIRSDEADVMENVVYSQPVGIEATGTTLTIRNNLVYDSGTVGLSILGGDGVDILNNTLFEPTAGALRIEKESRNVHLRNNIVWAQDGIGVLVAPGSETGFASDNNVFFRTILGSGSVGSFGGALRSTLADWRAATGTDTDSIFANPLFVDANGADNILGYQAGMSDGRDDDFHERSQFGSYHGGALAPVEGPSFFGPGAPVALVPVLTNDAQQSPAIGRGEESDPFVREPLPNGGYINVGAYGNTEQASRSPAEFIIVMAPNGGEVIQQTSTFDIRWHHAGGSTVDIEYSSTGLAGTFTTLAAGEANDGVYEWTVDPALFPIGDDYVIRVRSSANAAIADASDDTFEIIAPPLQVVSMTPTESGFDVLFNRAFDPTGFNLYDGAGGSFGAADVVLTGPTGDVRGSIVLRGDLMGFTFVRTGGVLPDGSYTLTLKSGAAAIHASGGTLLDGNNDGTGGDDFVVAYDVTGAAGPHIGIADFARGPEQEAGLQATLGVPITITGAGDITTASFEVHFDPAKLQVTGIENPVGGTATIDLSVAGVAKIDVTFDAAVGGANLVLGRLLGTVPASAPYGSKQLLDIRNVVVDDDATAVQDDDGVHVVAYAGDATGNAGYTSLDAQRVLRTVLRFDSGFSAYPLADPLIVGDVSGSGRIEAFDALLILREVLNFPVPEIPDLPANPPSVFRSGPDPLVTLGQVPAAKPGELVSVPVELDTAAGLDSAQLRIRYDADALKVVRVDKGSLTGDFDWFLKKEEPGLLTLDMSRMHAMSGGQGTLAVIIFQVDAQATTGRYAIDMQWASLNEDALTLNPAPQPGVDRTDTIISVTGHRRLPQAPLPAMAPPVSAAAPALDDLPPPVLPPSAAAPVIDLGVRSLASDPGKAVAAPAAAEKAWVSKFVNTLGSSTAERNPNAKLRIPVAPPPSVSVGR